MRTLAAETFDVVILNPPREGASPAVREGLRALAPARIVYVSCNPETLARDIAELPDHALARVIPVDLFG